MFDVKASNVSHLISGVVTNPAYYDTEGIVFFILLVT